PPQGTKNDRRNERCYGVPPRSMAARPSANIARQMRRRGSARESLGGSVNRSTERTRGPNRPGDAGRSVRGELRQQVIERHRPRNAESLAVVDSQRGDPGADLLGLDVFRDGG